MRILRIFLLLAVGAASTGACAGSDEQPAPTAAPARSAAGPSAGGRDVRWELPPADGRFDYQLGGAYPPAAGVEVVVRDRSAPPAPQVYTVCYVNAFQTQPGENAWWQQHHDGLLLRDKSKGGDYVEDADWPGERLLDISTAPKRAQLARIVGEWFGGCAAAGFRAIEPDNLDSWTRSDGLLDRAAAEAYAGLLIGDAHRRGLAIGQKNTPELGAGVAFDFAVAEECAVYDECGVYLDRYGDQVYEIEYTDNGTAAYRKACAGHGKRISVILRDRDVVPAGAAGYRYEAC